METLITLVFAAVCCLLLWTDFKKGQEMRKKRDELDFQIDLMAAIMNFPDAPEDVRKDAEIEFDKVWRRRERQFGRIRYRSPEIRYDVLAATIEAAKKEESK